MSTTIQPRTRRRTKPSYEALVRREIEWSNAAPTVVRQAAGRKQADGQWKAWKGWLAQRTPPKLPQLFRTAESPLTLGTCTVACSVANLPGRGDSAEIELSHDLLALLWRAARGKRRSVKSAAEQLPSWLAEADGGGVGVRYALECVAWCHALPYLAQRAPAESWWELLWHLVDIATEGRTADAVVDPLVAALLGAELSLTLAVLLPEIEECRKLAAPASAWLRQLMTEHAAEEVLFAVERLHLLRPTLACWTRSQALGGKRRKKKQTQGNIGLTPGEEDRGQDQRRAYRRLVLATIRWSTADGGQHFATDGDFAADSKDNAVKKDFRRLLNGAVKQDGSRGVRRAWQVFRESKRPGYETTIKRPCAGAPHEASSVAVLRSSWSSRAAAAAVSFGTTPLMLELTDGESPLLRGAWDFEIRQAGRSVGAPAIPWDVVCWESSRRAQWLEVELDLADGLRIQRGILLAPQDEFVLLIDVVIGEPGKDVEYVARLPLAAGVSADEEKETREISLKRGKSTGRVLPLALNEWRSDPRVGRIGIVDSALELRQQGREGSLCAPLWIDYSRARRQAPVTWRQLTVGEERRSLGRNVAVGFRVQVGVEQWLIYRAVSSVANRTLLGHNLATEFKVGRFLANGTVQTIVEIE